MKALPQFRPWQCGAALFILTFCAYLPILHGGFIWDDSVMVVDNQMLRSAAGLRDFWVTTKAVDPLPITMSALWLQWHIWDGNPFGYHLVGILLHAGGAVLLWRILLRLTGSSLAWLVAVIFALHPVAVASVAWISEQKNTLSLVFYFTALLCYIRFIDGRRTAQYFFALAAFVLALLSKGSTVMLPVVLLLLVWWKKNNVKRNGLLALLPFFLLSGAAALGTIWVQNHKAIAGEMNQQLDPVARIAAAAKVVWFYASKDLFPFQLCVIYPSWTVNKSSVLSWLPLFALIEVLVLGFLYRRTSWGRAFLLGAGCFVATLFPVMGFFNMYFLNFSRVADHWQYLALPIVIAGAVFGVSRCKFPPCLNIFVSVTVLATLFCLTWQRAGAYTNEKNIWSDTVKKNPNAWMAWNNLGNAYNAEGDNDNAIAAYEKALAVNGTFPDAESNLGNALVAKGRVKEAVPHLKLAVDEEPKMARFHMNYGVGLAELGKLNEAVDEYQAALALHPNGADVHNNLSGVYLRQQKRAEALQEAELAHQLNPQMSEPLLNAAKALDALGRTDEAARTYDAYFALRPDNAGAHFEYGLMLAMHGRLADALPHFQAVTRLKPNEPAGHSNLGNTYAALKHLDEAATEFRIALRLQPNDASIEGNLANALMETGKIDEALQHYAGSLRLNPNDATGHVNFAYALAQAGKKEEAVAQLRIALQLKPGDAEIQGRLNALQNAR